MHIVGDLTGLDVISLIIPKSIFVNLFICMNYSSPYSLIKFIFIFYFFIVVVLKTTTSHVPVTILKRFLTPLTFSLNARNMPTVSTSYGYLAHYLRFSFETILLAIRTYRPFNSFPTVLFPVLVL